MPPEIVSAPTQPDLTETPDWRSNYADLESQDRLSPTPTPSPTPDWFVNYADLAVPDAPHSATALAETDQIAGRIAAPYGLREDGTPKGSGFLGLLKRPDGRVSSELSIGVQIGGKETLIPSIVPTLTGDELHSLLNLREGEKPPQSVISKARDFAMHRIASGKSPFASEGEQGSPIALPRMGTMGVESKLMNLDTSEQPEWMMNAAQAAGETLMDFVPKSPEQVAGMLSPPVQMMGQEKEIFNTIKDWANGLPLDESIIKNDAQVAMFHAAEGTPALSKERFKVAFNVLAQLGMLYAGGKFLEAKGGGINAKQNIKTAQPDGLRTESGLPSQAEQPAAGQGGEGVPASGQGTPLGEGTTTAERADLLRPALRTQSGIVPGEKGQTHADIVMANPETVIQGEPEHGFVNVNQPEIFLDRTRAASDLGESEPLQSERLIELQKSSLPAGEGGESEPAAASSQGGAADTLPEGMMSVGGATPEEFMRRYALVGASHILQGKTDLRTFGQAMEQDFGPHIRDQLPAIMDRAKAVINEFQTGTGQSAMANEINRQIGVTRARETPVLVRPFVAQKAALLAAERAGQAGFKRGVKETLVKSKEAMKAERERSRQLVREARAEERAAAAQIKADLMQSDKFMAGDQEQVRLNMIEYAKAFLPPAERGRFLNSISKAMARPRLGADPSVMYRNAFRVMRAIERHADLVYRKELVSDIRKAVDRAIESTTVDVAYRRQLKSITDSIAFTKPSAKTTARLQSMKQFVERERAAGREPNISQDELDQLETLSRMPLSDMTANSLEQLRDRIESTVSLGKLKVKLLERQWEAERQRSIDELATVPADPIATRPIFRPQPTENLTFAQKFSNVLNRVMNARVKFEQIIAPMDEIFDHQDGSTGTYDGWTSRNVKGKIDLGHNETLADFLPIREEANAIIQKFGLRQADMETVGLKQVMNNIGRERLVEMKIDPGILDRIEKTDLTPGQQAYYDFARRTYDSLGPRVRDIAHRLYQQDMPIDPTYVPLQRDWAAFLEVNPPEPTADVISGDIPYNEKATMNQLARDINPKIISRTEQGFLKERIEGAKSAVRLNAHDVLMRHSMDALHFIHQQSNLKMLGQIVRSPEFAAKFGNEAQVIDLDFLDSIATQGSVNPMQRIRILDWIRNSTSKGAVGFRLASNFVHESQLPLAAYHAGNIAGRNFTRGMRMTLTEKGQAFLRKNAAETFVRSGGEPAQADVEAMTGKFGRAGFFIARNLDKLNAQAVFMGRYTKEMIAKYGITEGQVLDHPVDPEIQALALRRSHRAVASPFAKDIPQMTSRGKGVGGNVSVARMLNQFRNIFFDNYSSVRHDGLRVGVKEMQNVAESLRQGEIKQGAKQAGSLVSHEAAIAAAFLVGVAMETGIKMYTTLGINKVVDQFRDNPRAQKEDEANFVKQFEHHMINRVPFMGQIASAFMYGDTGIPLIDAIVKPIHELGVASKSKKPETVLKHQLRAAGAISTLAGVSGTSQLLDVIQAFIAPGETPPVSAKPAKKPKVPGITKPKLGKLK